MWAFKRRLDRLSTALSFTTTKNNSYWRLGMATRSAPVYPGGEFFLLYSPWFQKLPIDFLFYLGRWPWPYPASNEKWTWHDRVLRLNWPVKYPSHDTYLYLNAVALFDVWHWSVLRISSLLLWRLRDHFRRTLAQFGLHDGKLSLPLVWSRRLMVRKESTLT